MDIEYRKGIMFLRLTGILNRYTSFILDDMIKKMVNKAGIKYLLLNFENLSSIDVFGINTILNCYNKYFKKDGKLMICGYRKSINKTQNINNLLSCAFVLKNELSAFNLINI